MNHSKLIFHRVFVLLLAFFLMLSIGADDKIPQQVGQQTGSSPKRESRAVWLTTLNGLDWPKAKANTTEGRERQKQELCYLLDQLKAININTILLQTRVRGSVIYPSDIEPWDVALTGQYGKDPGYDPLQFAIEEAHKRGLELHAWVVTIPAYKIAQTKQMGKSGIHVKQAKLIKKHNDQYYLDPGQPATADYLQSICEEIVRKYDVDGLHFDYIRYPENAGSFPDSDSYKKFGAGKPKAQWRRDNITRVVRQIYTSVHNLKPWVRISSSPVGKFRDLKRYSSKGWNCYDAVYQDAQGWLSQGIHDAIYPMMYFKGNNFYPFAADWQEHSAGRMVAPGLGIYFMDRSEQNWPLSDITNELYYLRALGMGGQCYFRTKFLVDNVKGLYTFLHDVFYPHPSLTPAATWLDDVPPTEPKNVHSEPLAGRMERLVWDPSTDNMPAGVRYNVYASRQTPVDVTCAENLVAVALPTNSYTYNAAWAKSNGLHFRVTALDRFGNESVVPEPERKIFSPDGVEDTLYLPDRESEFYVLADMQGRILYTGVYAPYINIGRLPSGWYQLRTLSKNGSRRLRSFWKK